MDDDLLRKYGYVISSTYRIRVMKSLDGRVRTHKEISEDSGIHVKHISKILRELKENDLAECINEEMRKGRLFRLTDDGERLLEFFDERHSEP